MSSQERASSAPPQGQAGPAPADPESAGAGAIGQYLAKQRRLRGISLEELSERTRIPRRNLEHLESGAFDAKDDGFTRGFVRTVAEALGLDAAEAVMRISGEPRAEEDRALRAVRRVTRIRVGTLAAGVLGVLSAALWCARREPAPEVPETPSVTWRRDAVRHLLEDADARPSGSGEPAPERR